MLSFREVLLCKVIIINALFSCEAGMFDEIKNSLYGLKKVPGVSNFAKKLSQFSFDEIQVFDFFKNNFNKSYDDLEQQHSALIKFLINQRDINEHNLRFEEGLETFSMALWKYSDFSSFDINNFMNAFKMPVQQKSKAPDEIDINPPKSLDWVSKGYVSQVKNQKLCGSCWSFSTTGSVEGQIFKKTGVLENYSEQSLIDCNRNPMDGNYGCEGGDMITAFKFLISQKGIALSLDYPYKATDKLKCQYRPAKSKNRVISFETISAGNETLLQRMVAKHGPISVAVDASLSSFQSYKRGVYFDPKCTKNINHAMLLCGYGTDEKTKKDFWLLKNSYGKSWGEDGYMRIARNADNHCGIAEFASVPKV